MAKDNRSALNPFTGKEHHDNINDDKFLEECYREYYHIINNAQIADNSSEGQLIGNVASKLIQAVETYLSSIGRIDYVEDYYDKYSFLRQSYQFFYLNIFFWHSIFLLE